MTHTADIPLIAQMKKLIALSQNWPNQPVIQRAMFQAKTRHDFAAAFLALWEIEKKRPEIDSAMLSNPFIMDAIGIADSIKAEFKLMLDRRPASMFRLYKDEERVLEPVQARLTTRAYGGERGASFAATEPSLQAKRDAIEYRARNGSTHIGARLVRKKEVYQSFDQRLPKHW